MSSSYGLGIPELLVGEARILQANFARVLKELDATGTPTWTVSTGGPTTSSSTSSGKKAQALFTASSASEGEYEVRCTITSTGSPAQTIIRKFKLRVV